MNQDKIASLLISSEITVKESMHKLNETDYGILFVTDNNKSLIGTVTSGDIRRAIVNGVKFSEKIGNVMNKVFEIVKYNTPGIKNHVKNLMVKTRIDYIPVLDDKNKIVDIIAWTDFLEGRETFKTNSAAYPNKVVIMAGGKGSRLDPLTKIFPKPLFPIGNRPVIEIIMERFSRCGFNKFIYTLNYRKEYVKLFLKENNFPYDIGMVEEEDYAGTAGSLSLLKDKISEPFFVTNCDSLLDVDFEEILKWHKDHKAVITVIGCHNEVTIPFGVLELSDGKVEKMLEKPSHDVIINTGAYIMEPRILSYIPEHTKMDMDELINAVVRKEKITVFPIYGNWLDIGQFEEYKKSLEKLGDPENV